MNQTLLFNVQTGVSASGGFSVQQVDSSKINPISGNTQCMDTFYLNGISYVISFETNTGAYQICQVCDSSGMFLSQKAQGKVSFNATQLAMLNTGDTQLCLACDGTSGNINVLKIASDLSITQVYTLSAGAGITTLKSFAYRKQYFFIAYAIASGAVSKYEVDTTVNPITINEVWNASWAKGWTRFSFFQMGAENFFIKTNINYNKVNIDHFMDDPNEGSHPVLNIDAPPQMQGLNNVNAFTDQMGFPYFATYNANGLMTFNQIYGNCLGWTIKSQLNTSQGMRLMLALNANNENYIVLV